MLNQQFAAFVRIQIRQSISILFGQSISSSLTNEQVRSVTMDPAVSHAQTDATEALGVRLYTRAPITPRWLVNTVVPLVRPLSEERAGLVYLRRGWLHGPHVDVVAHPAPGLPTPSWSGIADRLDFGTVSENDEINEETYLAQAREMGRLEGVSPPYLPMRAHGTVELLSGENVEIWPQPLQGLRDIALDQMTPPLLATLDALTQDPAGAPVHVTEAFAALASAHRAGAAQGVFSMRSHAEAFLAWAAPRKDPRPAFDQRLKADAPRLRPVVEQALAGAGDPLTARWGRGFAYCMGGFDHAVATGQLTQAQVDGLGGGFDSDTMGPPGGDGRVAHQPSAFHSAVQASGVTDGPNEWFASYRLLVNLFYQQLPLLGVSPMHRYYFCYAIAELVDEVLGSSWQDRIAPAARETGVSPE